MKTRATIALSPLVNSEMCIGFYNTALQASDNAPCPHPASTTGVEPVSGKTDSSGTALNPIP